MTILDRLTVACVGFLATAVTVIAVSPSKSSSQPTEPPRALCEEVAHELNLFYLDGYISEAEAKRIIDRCFETFGQEL